MKIKFKNGSSITSVESEDKAIRSHMKLIVDTRKTNSIQRFIKKIFMKIFWKFRKKKKYAKWIEYWRRNPDIFCEEFLGMKLFDYQKKILKDMEKK